MSIVSLFSLLANFKSNVVYFIEKKNRVVIMLNDYL